MATGDRAQVQELTYCPCGCGRLAAHCMQALVENECYDLVDKLLERHELSPREVDTAVARAGLNPPVAREWARHLAAQGVNAAEMDYLTSVLGGGGVL